MRNFAAACERIAGTTKKLQKVAFVADYFKASAPEEAAVAAVFLSGRPFPVWEDTPLQVGGALLWRLVSEVSGKSEAELAEAYRRHGDLGAVAAAVFPVKASERELSAVQVLKEFRAIAAARGPAAKGALVRELLLHSSPLEAKYLIKIVTGDLRIGLKESLVEDAIARGYGSTLNAVQRTNMLLGDIGETLRLALDGKLDEARMRLFHPLGFMLASPAESSEEALSYFSGEPVRLWVEDKYDGIRAQAHCSGDEVRIFSRTRDEITASFPELPAALAGMPRDAILDGEIVAWSYLTDDSGSSGRALPFSALQQRLGRKKVSAEMLRRVPVAYVAFDVLYAGGELLIDRSLQDRGAIVDELLAGRQLRAHHAGTETRKAPPAASASGQSALALERAEFESETHVIRAPLYAASSAAELDQLFEAAQARGNEGLMIKDPASIYMPGRRGKAWLKLKRELATLDVVVTAVEYGHGRRIGVLSDYTFAVRDGERLVNIGKAYSGLTDVEIAEMTKWFLEHVMEDHGFRLMVEPKIVLEVAFNNMMQSERHESGYALRFPRIVRLRPDKPTEEADTLDRAKAIFEKQRH